MEKKKDKKKEEKKINEGNKKPERQPCEVFSRVVGYIRPVHQWNLGKQSEFKDRKMIKIEKDKNKRDRKKKSTRD